MNIKYVFKQTAVGWNWHPVIDGQMLFYPHGTLYGVRQFVHDHMDAINDYINSEDNLGLGFYVCGYDGDAQNRFRTEWEKLGVTVF